MNNYYNVLNNIGNISICRIWSTKTKEYRNIVVTIKL